MFLIMSPTASFISICAHHLCHEHANFFYVHDLLALEGLISTVHLDLLGQPVLGYLPLLRGQMLASLRQAGSKAYLELALCLREGILLASESFFVQMLRIH